MTTIPAWADENLYADEWALLADGVDWQNPVHVLLLRLANERRGQRRARTRLREMEGPAFGKPTDAEMEWIRASGMVEQIAEQVAARPEACQRGAHAWVRIEEGFVFDLAFPWLRCEGCGSGTEFEGDLSGAGAGWPGGPPLGTAVVAAPTPGPENVTHGGHEARPNTPAATMLQCSTTLALHAHAYASGRPEADPGMWSHVRHLAKELINVATSASGYVGPTGPRALPPEVE